MGYASFFEAKRKNYTMTINSLSNKYYSDTALKYDDRRKNNAKWIKENSIVDHYLSKFSKDTLVLDAPIGTGRFVPLYKKYDFPVTGFDVSNDMLALAKEKAQEQEVDIAFKNGSLFESEIPEASYDLVLCIRFVNWLHQNNASKVIHELNRISSKNIILGVRTLTPISEIFALGLKGMPVIARQIVRRFIKAPKEKGLHFHKRALLLKTFEQNKLIIEQSEYVEKRKDGTEYIIYQLRKTNV